ncbi:MAG: hypothetical protein LBM27_06215, partial [Lactobacillaceae bacterium]|nr:hypothetical protein [Lactobacillaceae bacterium]
KNDFHPSIIYALKDKPELFEDTEHRTVPRTLEFLSNLLKIADKNGIDVSAQDFESLIGSENAPQFKYIYDHIKQLVSLLDVVTDQNAKNDFDQMSDAEKSFIWLNGLHNVTAAFDEQMVEIAQTLPADTLMATLKTDTIWSTNNNLATTQFLAGAYKALEDIE